MSADPRVVITTSARLQPDILVHSFITRCKKMETPVSGLTLLQCYSDSDSENNQQDAEIITKVEPLKSLNELKDSSSESRQENARASWNTTSTRDSGLAETFGLLPRDSSIEENIAISKNLLELQNPLRLTPQSYSELQPRTTVSNQEATKSEDSLHESCNNNSKAVRDPNTSYNTTFMETADAISTDLSVEADDIDGKSCLNLLNPSKITSQHPSEPQPAIVEFSQPYRQAYSSESDSDSSSDESIISVPVNCVVDGVTENDDYENSNIPNNSKMLEDLGLLDLPPLEDLAISVPEAECIPIGTVSNIIDLLVLVTAKRGTPAVDLNSVLFLDNGKKTLGKVFDVFGQVNEPIYMVRFNSAEHISENGIQIGMEVFFAPRTPHTAFVFIDALMKMKGSDASWEHDQEPPEGCIEYSDDEEERNAKAAQRMRKAKQGEEGSSPLPRSKKQRQGSQFNRRHNNPSLNPFYMQSNQQYYPPHPSQTNMWTHHSPSWVPPSNQLPTWGPPPNQPPPPYVYSRFGGPSQIPPPS